jgi:hypothetical protein
MSSFVKIRPMGAELFHADRRTDGRTDMTKLIVAFHSFASRPKMVYFQPLTNGVTCKQRNLTWEIITSVVRLYVNPTTFSCAVTF